MFSIRFAVLLASCCWSVGMVSSFSSGNIPPIPAPKPNLLQRMLLRAGGGKVLREQVVERYFNGVQLQNREQIVSCFSPDGTKIRDVCGVSNSERLATPDELGERCMEFLAAHPDTTVLFHYGYVNRLCRCLPPIKIWKSHGIVTNLLTGSFHCHSYSIVKNSPKHKKPKIALLVDAGRVDGSSPIGTKRVRLAVPQEELSQMDRIWMLRAKHDFWSMMN